MNADGSDQRRVQNHPETDTSPTWSPDGTQIAFDSDRDTPSGGGSVNEIYATTLDGRERPVTRSAASRASRPGRRTTARSPTTYHGRHGHAAVATAARAAARPARSLATSDPHASTSSPTGRRTRRGWRSGRRAATCGRSPAAAGGCSRCWSATRAGLRAGLLARRPAPRLPPAGRRQRRDLRLGRERQQRQSPHLRRRLRLGSRLAAQAAARAAAARPCPDPPPAQPVTPAPPTPTGPPARPPPRSSGNRDDEDCDGVAEAYPVVSAIAEPDGPAGEGGAAGQPARPAGVRPGGRRDGVHVLPRALLAQARAAAQGGAADGPAGARRRGGGRLGPHRATLRIRIARDGYAPRSGPSGCARGGAMPWVERRTATCRAAAADGDCDGFRRPPRAAGARAARRVRREAGHAAADAAAEPAGRRGERGAGLPRARLPSGADAARPRCRRGRRRCGSTRSSRAPGCGRAPRCRSRSPAPAPSRVCTAGRSARAAQPVLRRLCQQPGARRPGRCPGG